MDLEIIIPSAIEAVAYTNLALGDSYIIDQSVPDT
jgi:hypothetical protein